MSANRSDFYALHFIEESTPGVDPGIIAASFVDGTSETDAYVVDTTRKGYIELRDAPGGIPDQELVEVPTVKQTHDYENCHLPGLRSQGEVTLTMTANGHLFTSEGRPSPPHWLQLAGSACGKILGYATGQVGGDTTTVDAGPLGPAEYDVVATALPCTVGDGAVHGVENSLAASGDGWELIRPTLGGGQTVEDASYNTGVVGLTATPNAGDPVHFSTAAMFDNRVCDDSKTYTILVSRPVSDSAVMLKGARCKSFVYKAKEGELATIELTVIYEAWTQYHPNADGGYDDEWTAEPVIAESPDYIDLFPCGDIVTNGRFAYQDSNLGVSRDLDITDLEVNWDSGYKRRGAITGTEGVADILPSDPQKLEVKFKCLYKEDWREFLRACCDPTVAKSFPVMFWLGDPPVLTGTPKIGNTQFVSLAAAKLIASPGNQEDYEGVQGQMVTLGCHRYTGDDNSFTGTNFADSRWVIGVI